MSVCRWCGKCHGCVCGKEGRALAAGTRVKIAFTMPKKPSTAITIENHLFHIAKLMDAGAVVGDVRIG